MDLVSLLANGLPPGSYYGKDWQSDKEAARVFSPGYVRTVHWDSYGACLYMFFTSLTTGLSLSSLLWQGNSSLLLRNAMVGYYWTLLLIAEKWDGDESDEKWVSHFLSEVTCRNVIQMTAQLCMRCVNWPVQVPFVPRSHMEECMELHFGRVKGQSMGTPCIRDGILATHQLHLKESTTAHKAQDPRASSFVRPLKANDVLDIGMSGLRIACQLQSCLVVGKSRKSLQKSLLRWWDEGGHKFVCQTAGRMEAEDRGHECEPDADAGQSKKKEDVVRALSSLARLADGHNASTGQSLGQSMAKAKETEAAEPTDMFDQGDDQTLGQSFGTPLQEKLCVKKILKDSGLYDFEPSPSDNSKMCIKRVQKMIPAILSFVRAVRLQPAVEIRFLFVFGCCLDVFLGMHVKIMLKSC